jgi:hypothetical protein
LCVTLLAVSGVLLLLSSSSEGGASTWWTEYNNFIFPVVVLAFALVGALVASRLPTNPIGWICLTIGLVMMLGGAADEYSGYALANRAGALPGGEYAAWLGNWSWIPAVGLMGTFTILLFPTGRLPSRR